jgi:hypothetical protein
MTALSPLPTVTQVEVNPGVPQTRLLALCEQLGVAVLGYTPLGQPPLLDAPPVVAAASDLGVSPAQVRRVAAAASWGLDLCAAVFVVRLCVRTCVVGRMRAWGRDAWLYFLLVDECVRCLLSACSPVRVGMRRTEAVLGRSVRLLPVCVLA